MVLLEKRPIFRSWSRTFQLTKGNRFSIIVAYLGFLIPIYVVATLLNMTFDHLNTIHSPYIIYTLRSVLIVYTFIAFFVSNLFSVMVYYALKETAEEAC